MADYGTLAVLREMLREDSDLKKEGLEGRVLLFSGQDLPLPQIVIDLEEIWTRQEHLIKGMPCARIRIKTHIASQSLSGRQSLILSQILRKAWEGKILILPKGFQGTVKLQNTVIEWPKIQSPRYVIQYYDVLVRYDEGDSVKGARGDSPTPC